MKGSTTGTSKVGFSIALERDREIARNTSETITPNILGARVRYKKRRVGNSIRVYYYLVKTYWADGRPHEKVLRYYGIKAPRQRGNSESRL